MSPFCCLLAKQWFISGLIADRYKLLERKAGHRAQPDAFCSLEERNRSSSQSWVVKTTANSPFSSLRISDGSVHYIIEGLIKEPWLSLQLNSSQVWITIYLIYPSDTGHRFLAEASADVWPGCCICHVKAECHNGIDLTSLTRGTCIQAVFFQSRHLQHGDLCTDMEDKATAHQSIY